MLKQNVVIFILLRFLQVFTKDVHVSDICGTYAGKKIYLDLQDRGILKAEYKDNILAPLKVPNNSKKEIDGYKKCSFEIITCSACVIDIRFKYLNATRKCGRQATFGSCNCEYVWIFEPEYEEVSGEQFCGYFFKPNTSEVSYSSQTRRVMIQFIFIEEYGHAFTLEFNSKRNKKVVTYQGINNNSSTVISSPFFPYFYPGDLNLEHEINCGNIEKCRIQLSFVDFRIAAESIIEILDWNNQRVYIASGGVFRPPILLSNGPRIVFKFYGNGGSDMGYKAFITYIRDDLNTTRIPNSNCGGYVTNLGGAITMLNMATNGTSVYDCIWIIRPPHSYLYLKTHLYVKVLTYDMEKGSELTLRQGMTSNDTVVQKLKNSGGKNSKEHIASLSQGFYISLKGYFRPESQLAIVYAAFSYKECSSVSDYPCHNLRCISILLKCDGFDHCGDSSDESDVCSKGHYYRPPWPKSPNFLFYNIDSSYSDLTTASFIFFASCIGLLGLVFAMVVLLYRVNVRSRSGNRRRIQDHLETIHAILEEGVGDIDDRIMLPDDPPTYEAPPDYANVMAYLKKIGSGLTLKGCPLTCSVGTLAGAWFEEEHNKLDAPLKTSSVASLKHQTSAKVPDSPPPSYVLNYSSFKEFQTPKFENDLVFDSGQGPSSAFNGEVSRSDISGKYGGVSGILSEDSVFASCQEIPASSRKIVSLSNSALRLRPRFFSDSELLYLSGFRNREGEDKASLSEIMRFKSYSLQDVSFRV